MKKILFLLILLAGASRGFCETINNGYGGYEIKKGSETVFCEICMSSHVYWSDISAVRPYRTVSWFGVSGTFECWGKVFEFLTELYQKREFIVTCSEVRISTITIDYIFRTRGEKSFLIERDKENK